MFARTRLKRKKRHRSTYKKLFGMLQIIRDVLLLLGSKAGLLPTIREDGGVNAALRFGARGEADFGFLKGARTERGEGPSSTSGFRGISLPSSTISVTLQRVAGSGGGLKYTVTGHGGGGGTCTHGKGGTAIPHDGGSEGGGYRHCGGRRQPTVRGGEAGEQSCAGAEAR